MVHIVEKHGPTATFTAAHTRGHDPSQLVHIYDHGRWTTVGVPKTHPESKATMRFFRAWFNCLDHSQSSDVFQHYLAVLRSAVDETHPLSSRRRELAIQSQMRPGLLSSLVLPTDNRLSRDRNTFVFGRSPRRLDGQSNNEPMMDRIYRDHPMDRELMATPPDQGPLYNAAGVLRMPPAARGQFITEGDS